MFDIEKSETNITINYNGVDYRVLEESDSGLLIVADEEKVKSNAYPIQLFAIPYVK